MKIHWDFLERRLSRFFGHYAILVSHYPTPFIVVPVIFCLTASYGFIWKYEERRGDLTLYTPNNARAKIELTKLEETFPINDSDPYFADRRPKFL
uniref:Uncharacterized protein n=1 Tax=Romanomermis culicivorax TaxID=13658 RepID=A0A915HVV4_ROMCU